MTALERTVSTNRLEMHHDMTPAYLPDAGSAEPAIVLNGAGVRRVLKRDPRAGQSVGCFETIAFDMRPEMP